MIDEGIGIGIEIETSGIPNGLIRLVGTPMAIMTMVTRRRGEVCKQNT